ncbi:hypothetical protein [Cryobacterium psychrophilum]|uniref:Uncharacterized protein n=1 Tax=Cryobacterium psychrophilum TaxID=41988 RepID=A0A4Y8KMA3_9MICO|nr:hypothetical protein [Cryobacterium psychrophilum]TDW31366.1 hypothetical protein EDD25_3175 [Cryobacterium psychrophilum]TFD78817.1 hypothetical protein E3T53_08450 [Cryobacterium psychrophilum]
MTDSPTAKPTGTGADRGSSSLGNASGLDLRNEAETRVLNLGQPATSAGSATPPASQSAAPNSPSAAQQADPPADPPPAESSSRPRASFPSVKGPQNIALVVLVGMVSLAVAFIVMIIVSVTSESINALAVIATPIASMVAAYYGITLSIQQVKNERDEKEKALARADAADVARREIEVWSAQMESGLRVAMAKLNAARVSTDEVTKAAGTPDDFF